MTGIERPATDIGRPGCHNASGPPTSAYQVPNGPRPLQSTRTGHAMRRPACRSSRSCSWSRVAAARYSSQIAWTRAGSRSASIYAARTSEPNAFAGDPQPPRASSTTASGAADTSLSGSGSGCARSDHGQKAVANFLSARPGFCGRKNVKDSKTFHSIRVIERKPIGNTTAAIMPSN